MKRVESLLAQLKLINIEAVFVTNDMNRLYLSGFTGSTGHLYISNNQKVMLTDFRYLEQAAIECVGFEVVDINQIGLAKTLVALLEKDGLNKLGFEEKSLTYKEFKQYEASIENIDLMPIGDVIEQIRMIKDADEIEKVRAAAHVGDLAFSHILSFLKPGVKEVDIAIELEFFMKKAGAQKLSFDTIVASGIRSSLPHAQPTNKILELGDFVTLDFGCLLNRYCSDMTRTVVIGKASSEQKKIYNIVLEAQLAALNGIHAGLKGVEVDKISRDIITAAGYGEQFGHGLGHSLGLEVHENPRFSSKDESIILENTIMSVEPGIYVPNFGGVRIEDLICVKATGIDNFVHSEKQLIEL